MKGKYSDVFSRGDAERIGKSQSYIYAMRRDKNDLFKAFKKYGNGDFIAGYNKAHNDYQETLSEFTDVFHYLNEKKGFRVCKWLKSNGGSEDSLRNLIRGRTPHNIFYRMQEMQDLMTEEMIEEKNKWLEDICEA